MRHRIARLLRRAANRLDPPRYWGKSTTTGTTAPPARIVRIHTGADPRIVTGAMTLAAAQQRVAHAREALADAQQALVDAERRRPA